MGGFVGRFVGGFVGGFVGAADGCWVFCGHSEQVPRQFWAMKLKKELVSSQNPIPFQNSQVAATSDESAQAVGTLVGTEVGKPVGVEVAGAVVLGAEVVGDRVVAWHSEQVARQLTSIKLKKSLLWAQCPIPSHNSQYVVSNKSTQGSGDPVGVGVGALVGSNVVGIEVVGCVTVGSEVGCKVGSAVGRVLGVSVGARVGVPVGADVVGSEVVGSEVVGVVVGRKVGTAVGRGVG